LRIAKMNKEMREMDGAFGQSGPNSEGEECGGVASGARGGRAHARKRIQAKMNQISDWALGGPPNTQKQKRLSSQTHPFSLASFHMLSSAGADFRDVGYERSEQGMLCAITSAQNNRVQVETLEQLYESSMRCYYVPQSGAITLPRVPN
ncbi:hypothetical protein GOODEAATRI_018600, partial [Goodea atripinnis]